jgi:hypothetical protein
MSYTPQGKSVQVSWLSWLCWDGEKLDFVGDEELKTLLPKGVDWFGVSDVAPASSFLILFKE